MTPPIEPSQNQGHHQGSFQVVNMNSGGPSGGVVAPPSGWTVGGKGRTFMRTTGSGGGSPG